MNLATSLIGGIANQFIRDRLATWIGKRLIGAIVVNGIIAVLGLAALAFLYIVLDQLVAERFGETEAAAILLAGNLGAIATILMARAVARARRRTVVRSNLARFAMESPEMVLALALGRRLEGKLRKIAPEMTITAAVIGLLVGAKPEILDGLLRGRDRR